MDFFSKQKEGMKMKIRSMVQIALMAAVLCVLSPFSIPLSLVPISLGTLGVYLAALLLGWKKGTVSVLLYLLLGCIGLPVFAGGAAGLQVAVGPTGGYMLGYVAIALIAGLFVEKFEGRLLFYILGMALGTLACYLLGSLWLAYCNSLSFGAALAGGMVPFLPGDAVKIAVSAGIGYPLRKHLKKAGI